MSYLMDLGFSETFIDDIRKTYDENVIDLIKLEDYNITEIVKYLREIGIKYVEDLFLSYIELFLRDVDEVKEAFNKHNIDEIVNKINEDITNIELV